MRSREKNNPFRFLPMDIGRLVCSALLPIYRYRRIHVSGEQYKKHIKGGTIIASNHTGFSDPFFIGTAFWYRRVFFLAAKEVMKNGIVEILLKGMGCIKIDRETSDINAIRKCVNLLKEGRILSVFPQGGISVNSEIDKLKSGAVLMALQAEVPIIPAYTLKREHWWQRQRIVIGDEFDCKQLCGKKFPSVADMEKLSEELSQKIEECRKVYEQTK